MRFIGYILLLVLLTLNGQMAAADEDVWRTIYTDRKCMNTEHGLVCLDVGDTEHTNLWGVEYKHRMRIERQHGTYEMRITYQM